MLKIRPVTLEDAPELVRIYAPYVEKTAITFEYQVPTIEEFEGRIEKTLQRFPYLVAEVDGQVLAYAYASTYYDRSAYDWAVEVSVYVDQDYHGQGLGTRLYETLESELEARGYLRFLACIALPNPASIAPVSYTHLYLEIEGVLEGYEVIDPHSYSGFDEMVASLVERRKGKMTEEEARQILQDDVNYFGVMLVHLGIVDGMVSGAIHSTAATVRPALQIIKTRPNVKRTSGAFLMVRGSERYLFGDCAININPDAEGLAEIAINSAISFKRDSRLRT